jgi:hypothetical protein
MFGNSKHCQICGVDVNKETAIKRFGKYLCSEEHAEQFATKIREEERQNEERRREGHERRGGCC